MSVQFIETADGKRLAVLPEADYRALIEAKEENSDLAAVREFDGRLARGEEELIPRGVRQPHGRRREQD